MDQHLVRKKNYIYIWLRLNTPSLVTEMIQSASDHNSLWLTQKSCATLSANQSKSGTKLIATVCSHAFFPRLASAAVISFALWLTHLIFSTWSCLSRSASLPYSINTQKQRRIYTILIIPWALTICGGLRIRINSLVCSKSVWAENEM